jgi:class 3 adenylate cyclase
LEVRLKSFESFILCLLLGFLSAPVHADLGRYALPYEEKIRPQLKVPDTSSRVEERLALEKFLEQKDLTDELRYAGQRQFLFFSEFSDRDSFHRVRSQMQPKADDYLLLSTYAQYDSTLNYLQLIEKLEHYFVQAQKEEPKSEVAGWIAHDTLGVMTDHYDFGRASLLVHKAISQLPEESWLLRSLLLGAIARLYVDPGNSPAIVKQGLAIYAENENRMRARGLIAEASDSAYNQGIGVLFAFGDHQKALEHFGRVSPKAVYAQDALVFSALALSHLGRQAEARARLEQVNFKNYPESAMRLSFLACYMELVRQRLGSKADLQKCVQLPESTQGDVIQHMTDEILQLPLTPALEMAVLKQFQNFYRQKISPQSKKRMAQSVDGLELARARAESDRSRYESRISRIELDLAQKQSQLTAYSAGSAMILLGLVLFGLWRRQVQQHRLQNLQQYLQTRILSRFLPPALVEEIRLGRSRLEEEPQKRIVTILFADLVSFTAKAEQIGTERTARLLNQWMHMATDVVFAENGTIDKFIGDCVMVIFGAPLDLTPEAQVERAVACAHHLMRAMEEKNKSWMQDFGVSFELRVGINLGEAIVGSFGNEKRSDYTVIGGAVNLASRIENMAEPGQILLSQSAARYLPEDRVSGLGARSVRGMKGTQELFELQREPWQSAV